MIEKVSTWLRQHFCMHEWVSDGDLSRFSVREDDGLIYECQTETLECKRCGKRRERFLRIPHG